MAALFLMTKKLKFYSLKSNEQYHGIQAQKGILGLLLIAFAIFIYVKK